MIADADQEWVYIESGDVRGFVRTDYLQQGKEALEYVTGTREDQMKLADQVIDPSENEAFPYKKETVYEVKPQPETVLSHLQNSSLADHTSGVETPDGRY